jgi:hypothetical protein
MDRDLFVKLLVLQVAVLLRLRRRSAVA